MAESDDTRDGRSAPDSADPADSNEDSFDALLREAAQVPDRPVRVPGTVLGGRYRLDRLLGEGGMGIVWAATHEVTRKRVALKLMSGPRSLHPSMRQRFLREARAASAVEHPNVVPIRDVFELDDGELVMVMDLLDGETLRSKLDRDGPLSLEETADLLLPAVAAVGTAHAHRVVHRDLKPENLVLSGEPPEAKVLDFGLAKLLPDAQVTMASRGITHTGEPLGTPSYMAPEQALGERDVDQRADVWSFGAIVFECVTGRRFVEENTFARVIRRLSAPGPLPSASGAEMPSDVTALLDRMLVVDRTERLDDLRPLFDLLAEHATRRTVPYPAADRAVTSSRPDGPAGEPRRHRWRFGRALLLGAAAGLVVAGAALVVGGKTDRADADGTTNDEHDQTPVNGATHPAAPSGRTPAVSSGPIEPPSIATEPARPEDEATPARTPPDRVTRREHPGGATTAPPTTPSGRDRTAAPTGTPTPPDLTSGDPEREDDDDAPPKESGLIEDVPY